MTNTDTITEILLAKQDAGADSYLWLHDSGDCLLWPTEEASQNDNGRRAIGRWELSASEVDALIALDICDELA